MTDSLGRPYTLRPVVDQDWDAIAALMNLYENSEFTGDRLRERNAIWGANDPRMLAVVADADDRVVGYCRSARRESEPKGIFRVGIYVHPDVTMRGLGRELLHRATTFAIEQGAASLLSTVEAKCDRGLAFAKKAGFQPEQYLFESRLDLTSFDPEPFASLREPLERKGFSFNTMEEIGDGEAAWRSLYELDTKTDQDTPGAENWGLGTFEEYVKLQKSGHGFSLAGVQVALLDGRWVGVNIVAATPKEGEMWTNYTGVRREHRGEGLALALKIEGIRHAQKLGMRVLATNNDERNAPMLAINRKLGFVESPGFFIYKKRL